MPCCLRWSGAATATFWRCTQLSGTVRALVILARRIPLCISKYSRYSLSLLRVVEMVSISNILFDIHRTKNFVTVAGPELGLTQQQLRASEESRMLRKITYASNKCSFIICDGLAMQNYWEDYTMVTHISRASYVCAASVYLEHVMLCFS